MSDPKVTSWPELSRVAPRLFDEQGAVRESPPVGAVYQALGFAERERGNGTLLLEARRFVGTFGDRFESGDQDQFRRALASLEQRATAAPLPPDPTSITARSAPVARARAEITSAHLTVLWQPPAQLDPDAPPQAIATTRITQSDNRETIIWEVKVTEVLGEDRWEDFVRKTWGSTTRISWLRDHKLVIQITGEGRVQLNSDKIAQVVRDLLPQARDVVLLSSEVKPVGETVTPTAVAERDARTLIQEVRHLGMAKGAVEISGSMHTRLLQMVRGVWNGIYQTKGQAIQKALWEEFADLFSRTMVYRIPKDRLTRDVIHAVGNLLVQEWIEIFQQTPLHERVVAKLLLRISAREIATLPAKYLKAFIARAATMSDPIASLERYEANRVAVLDYLTQKGVRVARSIAVEDYCFEAEDRATAITRADEVARAWQEGRWRAGTHYQRSETPPPVSNVDSQEWIDMVRQFQRTAHAPKFPGKFEWFRKVCADFYRNLESPTVPLDAWEALSKRFALNGSEATPSEGITDQTITAMAEVLYQDLVKLQRETNLQLEKTAPLLARMSAVELIGIWRTLESRGCPETIIYRAFQSKRPQVDIAQWAKEYLAGDGNRGGPKGGGTPPPAPAGGGGGGVSEAVEGDSSRSALRMTDEPALRMTPRFGRALERVGGVATVGSALSVVSVLKDTGRLSEQQTRWVHNGMLAGMVVVDGGFLVSLGAGMIPAHFAQQAGEKFAKKAGVENPIAKNLIGLWGGLAGFEASEYLFRHSRRYNEWRSASVVSTRQLAAHVSNTVGQVGFAIEESLTRTWQNISTGLRVYGKEVVAGLSMLGENLATGGLFLATVASCLVTPIFTINGLDTWGNKMPDAF